MHTSDEKGTMSGFEGLLMTECPSCGETLPRSASRCDKCGVVIDTDEDPEPFTAFSGAAAGVTAEVGGKTPLLESKTHLALLQAKDGATNGAITLEEYQSLLQKPLYLSSLGVELFKQDVVINRVKDLPEEEKNLVHRTADLFKAFLDGVTKMSQYKGGEDVSGVQAGFKAAEDAMGVLDGIRDRALEIVAGRKKE